MVGLFSFTWKFLNNILCYSKKKTTYGKSNGAIAGAVAGLAVIVETRSNRIAVAQQLSVRSLQAGYNALKYRNVIHLKHGDTFLFALACASISYAYVMYEKTMPKEYYNWMLGTGFTFNDFSKSTP
jgi:hypothetical protein